MNDYAAKIILVVSWAEWMIEFSILLRDTKFCKKETESINNLAWTAQCEQFAPFSFTARSY